ncbi:hypothetical protein KY289_023715 [Solanum tuberosum]|nr:hypothetical protein KY289_023715 [Solanum tuberosum]
MAEDSIPQDITIQTFSWLPVKSLMHQRGDTKLIACVDDAIEDHHDEEDGNATNILPFAIPLLEKYCIWDLKYIAICNPATREVRFLPDVPHEGVDVICSIGYELEENKYKVVVTIETYGKLSRAWVFTLGIDKSWREVIKYGEHDCSGLLYSCV